MNNEHLTYFLRDYNMERIAITGAFNSWKSTCISSLRDLGFNVRDEVARKILKQMNIRPEDMTQKQLDDFQKEVYFQQVKEEILHKYHLMDASVIDILAYSKDSSVYEYLYEVVKWYLEQNPYRKVFLLEPIDDIEDDWLRHLDKDFQNEIYKRIKEILEDFEIKYIIVTGWIQDRLDMILNNIPKHEYKRK